MSTADHGAAPSRRRMLRITRDGLLTAATAGAGLLSYRAYAQRVVGAETGAAFDAWDTWQADQGLTGTVAAAVLAPSPHNTQPWEFHVQAGRVDLFVDTERWMPSVDPYRREAHVSLGCALENLTLAAKARGWDPRVTLAPDPDDPLLIARVDLTPGKAQDTALHQAIGQRHSNRGPYQSRSIPEGTLTELSGLAGGGPASTRWVTTPADLADVGALMVTAAQAVTDDDGQSRDGYRWLRSDADQVERHKDGLTLDAQGLNAPTTAAAKLLPAYSRQAGDRFWVEQTRTVHTPTAAAYGFVLVADAHDEADQIAGGRLLQRLHLGATVRGLAFQHMNQISERIDREQSLGLPSWFQPRLDAVVQTPPDRQVVATFRIGYPARQPARSPRRPAAEVTR